MIIIPVDIVLDAAHAQVHALEPLELEGGPVEVGPRPVLEFRHPGGRIVGGDRHPLAVGMVADRVERLNTVPVGHHVLEAEDGDLVEFGLDVSDHIWEALGVVGDLVAHDAGIICRCLPGECDGCAVGELEDIGKDRRRGRCCVDCDIAAGPGTHMSEQVHGDHTEEPLALAEVREGQGLAEDLDADDHGRRPRGALRVPPNLVVGDADAVVDGG